MRDYYENDNANPHRGAYELSARATERYHQARERIARFVGVADADCLIFVRGTTEALNLVAWSWGRANVEGRRRDRRHRRWSTTPTSSPGSSSRCERKAKLKIVPSDRRRRDRSRRSARADTRENESRRIRSRLERARDDQSRGATSRAWREPSVRSSVCDGAQAAPHCRRLRLARRRLLRLQRPQDARPDGDRRRWSESARCSRRCRLTRPAAT